MHTVQLADQLYKEAERRAREAGFTSVDEFVADFLENEFGGDDTENLEHLFTPERLAHIQRAEADIEAGNFYTSEQARAELAKRRAEWLLKNPR